MVPRVLSVKETHLSCQHTTHSLQRRGLRSLDSVGRPYPDNIILSLPAFGRDLYLNLTRDTTFLSGDFVVEEMRSDQIAAVNRLSMNQLCFYSGSIVNHTDSLVSISTCGGLVSTSTPLALTLKPPVCNMHFINQSHCLWAGSLLQTSSCLGVWGWGL